jgi:aspartyl-tRNA(Asn)/glutamyl-tRNA(Gln) amidotransferase subunit A
MTAAALAAAVRSGATTAEAATRRRLDRIARLDPALGAFVAVDPDRALAEARALDAEVRAGRVRGPLHGVPVAYKDLCVVAGLPTRCGTAARDYFPGGGESDVVGRLRAAGAVTLGKVTMTELAMGTFGENRAQGTPRNPWDAARVPGGSSSGSAVAVAAGLAPLAVGSDTGGSIRIPAACCGLWGLKPTYDLVSRGGVMPLAPSLDHLGPFARTPEDLGLALAAMTGGAPAPAAPPSASRVVVGVARDGYFGDCHAAVEAALDEAERTLARAGAAVERLPVPDPGALMDATTVIVRREAALAHGAALRERPEDLQPFTRARLEAGLAIPDADYRAALAALARLRAEFLAAVFARVDVLLAPIVPEPPPALAEVTAGTPAEVQARMTRWSRFARIFNGLGVPTLAVPCGLSADGLPVAVQAAARPGEDRALLALAARWDTARGAAPLVPPNFPEESPHG